MELALALLLAGPLGYLMRDSRRALLIYLAVAALVFPIQCLVVQAAGDLDPSYWPLNAAIVGVGVGLNRLGAHLRTRRHASVDLDDHLHLDRSVQR